MAFNNEQKLNRTANKNKQDMTSVEQFKREQLTNRFTYKMIRIIKTNVIYSTTVDYLLGTCI